MAGAEEQVTLTYAVEDDVPLAEALKKFPEATVTRLPIYQRILSQLLRTGIQTVSSSSLADMARINAAKVRRDLSLLGSLGTRGTGYDTEFLMARIDAALGVDQAWPVAIVGVGNLGRALANSPGFSSRGFFVCGLFDTDIHVVGSQVGDLVVRHIDELRSDPDFKPSIGVIATPGEVAQLVSDALIAAGAKSILNFAPIVLHVPPDVLLRYVDLSMELQVMSFYQSHRFPVEEESERVPLLGTVGLTSAEL